MDVERVRKMADYMQESVIVAISLVISFIVWLLRLEAKVKQGDLDIARISIAHDKLADKHEALDQRVMEKLEKMSSTLARIEERLIIRHNTHTL